MDIELRLLRSLVAIYEKGSISRAAELLNCTQAAMSMRLKMLEEEVGTPLFLRRHQRMEPTSRGSEIYAKALGVLASYDELISATRRDSVPGPFRIGVPDDYALGILADFIRAESGNWHALGLEIACDLSANLVAALQRGDLDCALVTVAAPPAQARLAFAADLHWVAAEGAAFASGETVRLSAYPEGCVFRRAMIEALERVGAPWRVAAQSRTHAGILSAVRAGFGVTAMAAGTVPPDLAIVPPGVMLPALPPISIHLVERSETPSPVAERLAAALARKFRPLSSAASPAASQ